VRAEDGGAAGAGAAGAGGGQQEERRDRDERAATAGADVRGRGRGHCRALPPRGICDRGDSLGRARSAGAVTRGRSHCCGQMRRGGRHVRSIGEGGAACEGAEDGDGEK
jgi:hypothetical protein